MTRYDNQLDSADPSLLATPTLRNGRAIDLIPGLPQVYRFKAYGAEGFDYAFMEADGFVEAPYVICGGTGMFVLPGSFAPEFNAAIRAAGGRALNTYQSPRVYGAFAHLNWADVVAFAQRWNARFNQQAFDMLCRAGRGAAERGQEAA